jgi:hypothetical protein
MSRLKVTDPDGVQWRVWRRWYPWRRWVTLPDIGRAVGEASGFGPDDRGDDTFGCLLLVVLLPLLALGLAASLLDLVGQLLVLPFVLLGRIFGMLSWPVQVDRDNKHVRTHRVRGFGPAASLRTALAEQIRAGVLPGPAPNSADAA